MNSVVLIGRLTADPELRYTPSNMAVAHFTLAVDRPVQQGQERQADFIRITVFGRQAETVQRYLQKGSQAAIQGRIQTGSYQNREGQKVYTTDIVANRVEFIGGRPNNGGNSGNGGYNNGQQGGSYGGNNGGQGQSYGQNYGGSDYSQPQSGGNDFGGSDFPGEQDFPDSFQAADDDIPF